MVRCYQFSIVGTFSGSPGDHCCGVLHEIPRAAMQSNKTSANASIYYNTMKSLPYGELRTSLSKISLIKSNRTYSSPTASPPSKARGD